jgi:predicted DNA-binding transcriptional regulator YafY
MDQNDTSRLSRLTSILIILQSKRMITSRQIADKFKVSVRTVYRDIKALEEAGVPVVTEEGKGYSLMEGYRIPPFMFTEEEAIAMITAERIIRSSKDQSLTKEFSEAVQKVRAILSYANKDKADLLESRVIIGKSFMMENTSRHLIMIQQALVNYRLVELQYADALGNESTRVVEPFGIYNSITEDWLFIAFCRLRQDFRSFRMDRIRSLSVLSEHFEVHKLTMEQYAKKHFAPPENF